MTLRIGRHVLAGRAVLAPMAGITDQPFRALARQFGAALCGAEMLSANQQLWTTSKSKRRLSHADEPGIRAVQLAGSDPAEMAAAAQHNVALGADLIDINMGCPAKKVCNRLCGSALLSDEPLVERILDAVVRAVSVPVTLKIRTGPAPGARNAVRIAQLAERCGIAALAVHGRTRADLFRGRAEYDTIRDVKSAVGIPVIANGDIDSPQHAQQVLDYTGADAVMIGRGAQGSPWIFRDVNAYLDGAQFPSPLLRPTISGIILQHIESLYAYYGEYTGVRVARKHLAWYCQRQPSTQEWRRTLMAAEDSASQFAAARQLFGDWAANEEDWQGVNNK
jgi:tRNA-dihydrouridine synthase B